MQIDCSECHLCILWEFVVVWGGAGGRVVAYKKIPNIDCGIT